MSLWNQQLWQKESTRGRRIAKIIGALTIAFVFVSILLIAWVTQPFVSSVSVSTTAMSISPDRLRAHVEKLSNEFYPRNSQNLKNLDAAADYIRSEFGSTGGEVTEQVFSANGSEYRNIILKLGDSDGERIVIGAHYDAAFDTHGADDNASGVAGLIELGRALAESKHHLPLELVAYSLEEPPYFGSQQMGSFVHAQSLSEKGTNIRLMICLEMIGYYSDDPYSQDFPLIVGQLLYPTRGNFAALVGDLTNVSTVRRLKSSMNSIDGIKTYSLNAPSFVTGVDLSDHKNYWQFGFDAVMVTDTAFFRNKMYHSVGDTADRLDYQRMASVVSAVNAAVLNEAQ